MKKIFKSGKVLFGIGALMLTACLSTAFATPPRKKKFLGIDSHFNPIYSIEYTGEVAKNQTAALTEVMRDYMTDLKKKLTVNFSLGKSLRLSCKTKKEYDEKLLSQLSSGQVKGACSEFSTCLQWLFDKHGLENYLLNLSDPNDPQDDQHVAVLYKYNGEWRVADPMTDVQDPTGQNTYFKGNRISIKLNDYIKNAKKVFGFKSGPRFGIEILDDCSELPEILIFPLDAFLSFNS